MLFPMLVALFGGTLAPGAEARTEPPPRLVLVLVVDQMRADYLDRFGPQFVGGFRWLLDSGLVFSQAHHDHAVTSTAPGHATIATGTHPSRHGIVGNDFFDPALGRSVYSGADPDVEILGFPGALGRSPVKLLRGTLGDWLKAANPRSRVFSVAIKDRSAIMMGGRNPDGVYWYHYRTGRFVTSSYYRGSYPDWVETFNASGRAARYYGLSWTRLLPDSEYVSSRGDEFAAEKTDMGSSFPHQLSGSGEDPDGEYFGHLPWTPFGDELTLDFAAKLLVEEELGRDDDVDILFVGLSSADFIGHAYGPYSQEVQDYYLRLDRLLAALFRLAQGRTGGRYLVALSADHGVMPMPEELISRGIEAARVDPALLAESVRLAIAEAGDRDLLTEVPGFDLAPGLAFRFETTPPSAEARKALRRLVADHVESQGLLGAVLTYDELAADTSEDELYSKFRRCFHPDRAPDILIAPKRFQLLTGSSTGTSHGSPYEYDTHVPLAFAGAGIAPARVDGFVRTVDIAPTLAALMGIRPPADLDGRDLRPSGSLGSTPAEGELKLPSRLHEPGGRDRDR